jgi:DNA helicase HerA-like ATPase
MTAHPIPNAALDDRLFFGGIAGSGKTYGAGTAVERLLSTTARVVIPDPLGVWWGLALGSDGKTPSSFRRQEKLVIFGGPRGDLGLTEHSGALIGETVAGMAESCILDLSDLKTGAAERRFMLAFLSALYNHKTREPLHVVFDEADLWAPQRILDKEGEAMKLLGMMENICRRGRVKGFIPWLISQRPAVISKNVLSQIDGLIAFKLTSVQDRDAIGDWVQGQADKAEWAKIWGNMPTLERGQGLVWLPARGILKTSPFPAKVTFDSSRTPKRGERVASAKPLQPVNLDRLKERRFHNDILLV